MKKNDFILIAGILFTALVILSINILFVKKEGNVVVITRDGEEYKKLDLDKDNIVEIKGENNNTNILKIENGQAAMIDASCPDLLCVHQKSIKYQGETIVCLPNKIVIEIKSDKKSNIDAVAE